MILFGAIFGFIFFLSELESPSMGNILFRINSDGIKEFSFDSLINMMFAPLKYIYFWTDSNLWSVNWIITVLIGIVIYKTLELLIL